VTTTNVNRLGKRLRKMRADAGWTLDFVSKAYGIDKAVLSRVERGESQPSLTTLRRLRDAYAVDDDVFLAWIDLLPDAKAAA